MASLVVGLLYIRALRNVEGARIASAGVLPGEEELQEESGTVTTCYREYFNWLYDGF